MKGFSLLELLIASLINSIILLGLLSLLGFSTKLKLTINDETTSTNNILVAIGYLSEPISQASGIYIGSCGSDSICTYEVVGNSQIAVIQPNTINKDCTGQSANINVGDTLVSVFRLTENNGQQSLYCRGYNLTQQSWVRNGRSIALVDGLTSLTASYLQRQTHSGASRYSYFTADSVTDWNAIVAVKIAIDTGINKDETLVALTNKSEAFND